MCERSSAPRRSPKAGSQLEPLALLLIDLRYWEASARNLLWAAHGYLYVA